MFKSIVFILLFSNLSFADNKAESSLRYGLEVEAGVGSAKGLVHLFDWNRIQFLNTKLVQRLEINIYLDYLKNNPSAFKDLPTEVKVLIDPEFRSHKDFSLTNFLQNDSSNMKTQTRPQNFDYFSQKFDQISLEEKRAKRWNELLNSENQGLLKSSIQLKNLSKRNQEIILIYFLTAESRLLRANLTKNLRQRFHHFNFIQDQDALELTYKEEYEQRDLELFIKDHKLLARLFGGEEEKSMLSPIEMQKIGKYKRFGSVHLHISGIKEVKEKAEVLNMYFFLKRLALGNYADLSQNLYVFSPDLKVKGLIRLISETEGRIEFRVFVEELESQIRFLDEALKRDGLEFRQYMRSIVEKLILANPSLPSMAAKTYQEEYLRLLYRLGLLVSREEIFPQKYLMRINKSEKELLNEQLETFNKNSKSPVERFAFLNLLRKDYSYVNTLPPRLEEKLKASLNSADFSENVFAIRMLETVGQDVFFQVENELKALVERIGWGGFPDGIMQSALGMLLKFGRKPSTRYMDTVLSDPRNFRAYVQSIFSWKAIESSKAEIIWILKNNNDPVVEEIILSQLMKKAPLSYYREHFENRKMPLAEFPMRDPRFQQRKNTHIKIKLDQYRRSCSQQF